MLLKINMYGKVFGKFTFIKTIKEYYGSIFDGTMAIETWRQRNGLVEVSSFSTTGYVFKDTYLFTNGDEQVMLRIEEDKA